MKRLWMSGVVLCAAVACTEDVSAPGLCPDFCPGGQITVVDTVLPVIGGDSAFRGYVLPQVASSMIAANLPGFVESRPIFRTSLVAPRMLVGTDTTTGAITKYDSAQLRLVISRRDTAAHNLTLLLSRLPRGIDTTSTFAGLDQVFTDSLIRTINLDTLIAHKVDPVTGDSAIVGTTGETLTLFVHLDTAHLHFAAADSARLAFGVRVSADTLAMLALTSTEGGAGPLLTWYVTVDSVGVPVKRTLAARATEFDSFVLDPPAPALDSTLAVGGVPSARSILRVTLPRAVRDSTQIVRATLELVPASAAQGVPIDSFQVFAHAVLADLGRKSPIAVDTVRHGTTRVYIGSTDTVRIDLTRLLRFWSADTTQATALILRAVPEGSTLAEIRFHPSSSAQYRPALRLTYVPRFRFGVP